MPNYWLMKSEPETFSIADLERVKVEPWTGVRSYFARIHLRAMSVGDEALFHHSSVNPPGVAGRARIVRTRVIDETQFDPDSPYFDPKATREAPIWDCVEVEYVETFPHFVTMDRLRADPSLADMMVLRRGMRLSVQPVTEAEYRRVVELGHTAPPPDVARPAPATKTPSRPTTARATKAAGRPTRPKRASKAKPAARSKVTAKAKPAAGRGRGTGRGTRR